MTTEFNLTSALREDLAACAVTSEDLEAVRRVCRAAEAYARAYEDASRFCEDEHKRRWLDRDSAGIDLDGETVDFHFSERDGCGHSYYFMLDDLVDPIASIERVDAKWHAENDARLERERQRAEEAAARAEERERVEYERLRMKFEELSE